MNKDIINTEIFKVRSATIQDLPCIISLLADDELGNSRESDLVQDKYYKAFAAINKDTNNHLVIIEYQNKVIGTLQLTVLHHLTHMGSRRGHIEGVRIDREYRNYGLGKFLIQWAIDKSRELNCHMVQLTTNKQRASALKFYEKIGFAASHEGLKFYL